MQKNRLTFRAQIAIGYGTFCLDIKQLVVHWLATQFRVDNLNLKQMKLFDVTPADYAEMLAV
ncbi:hypothetical protein JCM19232_4130 [Vibrio ishigakensis]|uniref:Uncharacterized protein n=1 Tax=Vibrio ishigakensis TaxID=1481914 RepID=A0A0B8PDG1_9VIBR|nr:hypothetical protein JCM19232_4130 [Vibrio ishigakensis]